MSSADVYAFLPRDQIERAVTVLDIAIGRGLAFERGLYYALESLGLDPALAPDHVSRLVEIAWRRRADRLSLRA